MFRLLPVLGSLLITVGFVAAAPVARAAVPEPPTPAGLPVLIEPLAGYVGQVACEPTLRRGTGRLARLLATTYRSYGATSWMSTYGCGTNGSRSEHYDGRAIDWMVDVHNRRQLAAARSAISWLLATDRLGHRCAMARRLGVMYLIFNNRTWGAWDGRWEEYNNCSHLPGRRYDNSCHRTHMHISLSWAGATGRTSYWTRRVALTDYGPCRPRDLNWAFRYVGRNVLGCVEFPRVRPQPDASATKRALVRYSGAGVRFGAQGPAVVAVQRAFGLPQTGVYGARTVAAVLAFQRRHEGCPESGRMNPATWRALLAARR
jgi:hypothetical protein